MLYYYDSGFKQNTSQWDLEGPFHAPVSSHI